MKHSDGALVPCEQAVEVVIVAFVHDVRRRFRERLLHVTAGQLRRRAGSDEMPEVGCGLVDRSHILHVGFERNLHRLVVSDGRVHVAPRPSSDERIELDLSEIVRWNSEVAVLVMPVPRSTAARSLDFEDSETSVLPLQNAVKGSAQIGLFAADELLVRTVRDEHFRMIGTETLAKLVLQGIAADDSPLVGDVLRFHTAGLLKPQIVRRLEGIQAENRAHVGTAHAGLTALQPREMTFRLLALPEPFDRVTFRVLEWDALHSFATFISWTSPLKKSMMRLQMAGADVLSAVFSSSLSALMAKTPSLLLKLSLTSPRPSSSWPSSP